MSNARTGWQRLRLGAAAAAVVVGASTASSLQAASATWTGLASPDNSWSTTGNWTDSPVPGASDTATFAGSGNGNTSVDVGALTTVQNLYFSPSPIATSAYTFTGTLLRVNNLGTLRVNPLVSSNQSINAAFRVGNSTSSSSSSYSVVNQGSGSLLFSGTFGNSSTSTSSNTKTVTIGGAGSISIAGGTTAGTLNLVKTGTGALTLGGSITHSGSMTLNGGNLILDYGNGDDSKLTSGTLGLAGGTLTLKGGSHVETMGSVTVSFGATHVRRDGGTAVLSLGSISSTRSARTGGVLNLAAGGLATTSTANTNGIVGGSSWATVGGVGTAEWAMNDGAGSIVAYDHATNGADWITGAKNNVTNYRLTGSSTNSSATVINALKINTNGAGQSLSIGSNSLTFGNGAGRFGGLLFVGVDDYTVTGTTGTLRSASITGGGEFILQQWGEGVLNLDVILSNAINGGVFTKAGPGTAVLSKSNTYTGGTFIADGVLSISSNANLGDEVTAGALRISGGTLKATSTFALDDGTNVRNVVLGGDGSTFEITGTNVLTLAGTVTNGSGAIGSLNKTGSGVLKLANANAYSGPTLIEQGKLELAVNGAIASTASVEIKAGAVLDADTLSTFAMDASQPFIFGLNPTGSGSAGLLVANELDISNATVSFSAVETPNDPAYVIASYSTLSGGQFAAVLNLPAGYSIDYDHNGGTQIAIVVPEPALLSLAGLLGLALRRKGRQPIGAIVRDV